jgi:hypothetical protein
MRLRGYGGRFSILLLMPAMHGRFPAYWLYFLYYDAPFKQKGAIFLWFSYCRYELM